MTNEERDALTKKLGDEIVSKMTAAEKEAVFVFLKFVQSNDLVFVNKRDFEELVADQKTLHALHAGGVDNWEWYDEAVSGLYADDVE